MAEGASIATAWVRIVPSVEGIEGEMATALAPATPAAEAAGASAGKGLAGKFGAALAGLAALDFVKKVTEGLLEIAESGDQMNISLERTTGATGKALDDLGKTTIDVANSTTASIKGATDIVGKLASGLQLTGPALDEAAKAVANFQQASGDKDTDTLVTTLKGLNISAEQTPGFLDAINKAAQGSGVSAEKLTSQLSKGGVALESLGLTANQAVGFMSSLDKAGIDGSAGVTKLAANIGKMQQPGETAEDAIKRVVNQMQALVKAGDTKDATALADNLFGTKNAPKFLNALAQGKINADQLTTAISGSAKGLDTSAEHTETFEEKFDQIKKNVVDAIMPDLAAGMKALSDATGVILPVITSFSNWAANNKPIFLGITAALLGIATVIGIVTIATIAQTVAQAALDAVMAPVTLIILALIVVLAALAVGIYEVVTHWQQITDFLKTVWNATVNWLHGTLNDIYGWWTGVWNSVVSWFEGVWSGFTGWLKSTWTGAVNTFKSVGNSISSWWSGLWNGVKSVATSALNAAKSAISSAINGIKSIVSSVGSGIKSAWSGIWSGLSGVAKGAFSGVSGAIRGEINGVIGIVNSAIRALDKVHVSIPKGVPGIGGTSFGVSIPTIPMLATGGTITGAGQVIVGEKGPELLNLPAGASVDPNISHAASNVTFNNYAPLGQSPAQALSQFANRARGVTL